MGVDIKIIDNRLSQLKKKKDSIKKMLIKYGVSIDEFDGNKTQMIQHFSLNCKNLKDLKIACVMDRFTLDSFSPECNLLEVSPSCWQEEIDEFKPDLLFIESAWQGKDGLWYRKIANGSKEFFEMASYCQDKNIPIVFWNKEDPVYTDVFMVVARMADVVFTTDIDCIKKYKETLKHDNVYHLHFAAQPKIHNPIEKYERKDKYCFAGAYYHRYKERAEVFDKFAEIFINHKGFGIYDRNYKSALPEHAFPSSYDKYILGKLDPSEIDIAYKGYNYGINMNSINQSQTMFARRLFEMLASNTVTIGNYSRGVKNYFGDLTICTNDEVTLEKDITKFCSDKTTFRKYRLLGLRKVLHQHLYEDRLDYIVKKVFDVSLKKQLPNIIAVGYAENATEANIIIENYSKQLYENKVLYIVAKEEYVNTEAKGVHILNGEEAKNVIISSLGSNNFIATINPNDYYGVNYFFDLALSTRYGNFSGIGKECYYSCDNNEFILQDTNNAYKYVKQLSSERSIINTSILKQQTIFDFAKPRIIESENLFSTDEFNYCKDYNESSCSVADDLTIYDQGLSINEIEQVAENIEYDKLNVNGTCLDSKEIINLCKIPIKSEVLFSNNNGKLSIESKLNEEIHQYIYLEKMFEIKDFEKEGKLFIIFNGIGDLDLTGTCVFYNDKRKKISPVFTGMNKLLISEVPYGTKYFKLGLRPKGSGKYKLDNIMIGIDKNPNEKCCFLSHSNVLVLTNQYPSKNELYRNMFVHKRMKSYKEEGYVFDVMRLNIYAKDEYREFEGINIVEGHGETLENILSKGKIDTVCVHFLDNQMWSVLKNYVDKIRIIIWSHGSDIQPWWRRKFNFTTDQELEKAKIMSEDRMKLWNEVFSIYQKKNIQFVFVSNYAANIVMEDYNIDLDKNKYYIIPNYIDTDLFNYIERDVDKRRKIISIRPYASNIYANDIMVKVIQELSKRSYFKELEFTVIGDGILFDELTKPIKKYKNVMVRKEFLKQDIIAQLYKQNGIVLIPSRGDTQGVSRDEAMSTGCVPITNAVTAIPEFVDESCGILADGEDYIAMANGIEKLYCEPDYFLMLSKNASDRVRSQSSKEFTIVKEIELIINKLIKYGISNDK